jgi:hypothetical protein
VYTFFVQLSSALLQASLVALCVRSPFLLTKNPKTSKLES